MGAVLDALLAGVCLTAAGETAYIAYAVRAHLREKGAADYLRAAPDRVRWELRTSSGRMGMTTPESQLSHFDADPESIAWARERIQKAIDRAERFHRHAAESDNPDAAEKWRFTAAFMRQSLLGGQTCVIALFDERLPEWVKALEESRPAAKCTHPREDVVVRVSGGPHAEYCKRCKTVITP